MCYTRLISIKNITFSVIIHRHSFHEMRKRGLEERIFNTAKVYEPMNGIDFGFVLDVHE